MFLRVIPDYLKSLTIYLLQCPLTFVSFTGLHSVAEVQLSSLYEFSHLFLMPLIVLESPLCPQGESRLLKENPEESSRCALLNGGRVGRNS